MSDRILLAVDGSEQATKAVEVAAALARTTGAAITVVHVVWTSGDAVIPEGLSEYGELEHVLITQHDLLVSAAESVVGKAVTRLTGTGVEVDSQVLVGDAAGRIVDVATDLDAAMIVMGSRGLGGFKSMMLGSTSHKVANAAPCTVVMVK